MKNVRIAITAAFVVTALIAPTAALAATDPGGGLPSKTVCRAVAQTRSSVTWTTGLRMVGQDNGRYGSVATSVSATKSCYGLIVQSVGSFCYVNPSHRSVSGDQPFNIARIGSYTSGVTAPTKTYVPPAGFLIHLILADSIGYMQATKTSAQYHTYISTVSLFPDWDN